MKQLRETRMRYSPLRKIIKDRMTQSALIPQFNLEIEMELRLLEETRAKLDPRPSVTSCLVWAIARALESHPHLNGFCYDEEVGRVDEINVGVAMSGRNGLVVPVIRHANRKTVLRIHHELRDLALRLEANRLTVDDFYGGTINFSNLGMYGIKRFTPLINPPQIAIVGAGCPQAGVAEKNGRLESYSFLSVCASIDHRAADGADAAKFLNDLKAICEGGFTVEEVCHDETGGMAEGPGKNAVVPESGGDPVDR